MRSFRFALLAFALALAVPLTATSAHAQIIPKFGATGGLNFGSLSDAAGADFENSTGYHLGVFGDFGFGPLAARASVLYVKIGNLDELRDEQNVLIDPDASVSFIAVPVDLQYRFPSPLVKPYALLGPEARFAMGDLADLNAESIALAFNLGVGAELSALIGPKVFAELRYGFDVTGFAPGDFDGDDSFKVNAFYLRVGVGL